MFSFLWADNGKESWELEKASKEYDNTKETASSSILDRYFRPVKEYLKVLELSRLIHSYIVVGEPGIGKSHTIVQGLKEMGKRYSRDYVILNGYSTPLALYEFLYYHNGKTIICDDISSIFKNETCKKILLSALWSPIGQRTIHYESKSDKLTVPNEFTFRGKMIIIANSLPVELENIKTRGLYYNLHFTFRERLEIIYELCRLYGIPPEIANFIRDNTNEAYEVNFRLPLIIWEIYKTHKNNGWETLALRQLRANSELLVARECLEQCASMNEAIKTFCRKTGLKKNFFYDCCGELVRRGMVEIEIPADN